MTLCKHDWVGDDECQYCRVEELAEDLRNARMENTVKYGTSHPEIYKDPLQVENASLKEQLDIADSESFAISLVAFKRGVMQGSERIVSLKQ